jgi:16S rRNA (guanine966-N2)-methyltransferase
MPKKSVAKPAARSAKPAVKGRGWLRIIGGVWRGRKFAVPDTSDLRPTNERAREAIFNRLMHAEEILKVRLRGAVVADLFAGSGALGLEALSRGAASVVFVERDLAACRALTNTLQDLHAEDRAEVVNADVMNLAPRHTPVDLILMDPPYGKNLVSLTLTALSARGWIRPGSLIVAETEAGTAMDLPPKYSLIDQRRYGRAEIAFITVTC